MNNKILAIGASVAILAVSILVWRLNPSIRADGGTTVEWTGLGTTNNWSDCANWTYNHCPTASDAVIFDELSNKDSYIDPSFSPNSLVGIELQRNNRGGVYTGTITAGKSLSMLSFQQEAGSFSLQDNQLSARSFILYGGTFNAGNGTIRLNWDASLPPSFIVEQQHDLSPDTYPRSAVFNAGTSTVIIDAKSIGTQRARLAGVVTFYNLTIDGSGDNTGNMTFWKPASQINISHTWLVKGPGSGSPLVLGRYSDETYGSYRWKVNPQSAVTFDGKVSVADSIAVSRIQAASVIDGGNNSGWSFVIPSVQGLSVANQTTTVIQTRKPIFKFTSVDTDSDEKVKYRIQVARASNFSNPAVDYTSDFVAVGATTYEGSPQLECESYYWRIQVSDRSGYTSDWVAANSGNSAFSVDPSLCAASPPTSSSSSSSSSNASSSASSSPPSSSAANTSAVTGSSSAPKGQAAQKTKSTNATTSASSEPSTGGAAVVAVGSASEDSPQSLATDLPASTRVGYQTSVAYLADQGENKVPVFSVLRFIIEDKSGRLLKNTKISLHSDVQTVTTDSNGIATFTNVPVGRHNLVYAKSKQSEMVPLDVALNDEHSQLLEQEPTQTLSLTLYPTEVQVPIQPSSFPWVSFSVASVGLIVLGALVWRLHLVHRWARRLRAGEEQINRG